jgi:hypothetical protein
LYSIERKTFKSRLFQRTIKPDNLDYWMYLYAEALYRLKQLEDLNCPCGSCFGDKIKTKHLLEKMENDEHIPQNKRPINFTGKGDCGRRPDDLPPAA